MEEDSSRDIPSTAQLKHFSLTRKQYSLLAEIDLQEGRLLKRPGQELGTLNDRGLIERAGQRLLLTGQGKAILDAIRALMNK